MTDSLGTARSFGTAETINFIAGTANVTLGTNGVMRLYRAGTANIVVSDGSISNGVGLRVTVTAAAASKLAFSQQPGNSTVTSPFSGQPQVTVQDTYGNTVTTDTSNVTLAIGTNPGGGSLTCTANPRAAVAGVATFSGCSTDKPGTGYTLRATDGLLTSANSAGWSRRPARLPSRRSRRISAVRGLPSASRSGPSRAVARVG